MGQFQNQPDFATKAEALTSLPYTPESPSAIYIGEKTDTAAARPLLLGSSDGVVAHRPGAAVSTQNTAAPGPGYGNS